MPINQDDIDAFAAPLADVLGDQRPADPAHADALTMPTGRELAWRLEQDARRAGYLEGLEAARLEAAMRIGADLGWSIDAGEGYDLALHDVIGAIRALAERQP